MIVSQDIHPDRQIYRLGALLLEVLQAIPEKQLRVFEVFEAVNRREKLSISLFCLTLDWLFLLGAVKLEKGAIIK